MPIFVDQAQENAILETFTKRLIEKRRMASAPTWEQIRDLVMNPTPKQRMLLDATWSGCMTGDPEYLLWGGTAGPGKSYGLRWIAILVLIRFFAELGLKGVQVGLFSKDYPSLRDRHVNRIKQMPEWLGKFNETTHDFVLRKEYGGGILSLRNLDQVTKYASAEFAVIFIEELTELDRDQLDELRTRKRWTGIPYNPVVAVCNPRHKGLAWVRKLWIEHDFSGEKDAPLATRKFWFLQALPEDNQHLAKSYYDTLRSLKPALRRALLEGDWYVTVDQAFPEFTRWKRDRSGQFIKKPLSVETAMLDALASDDWDTEDEEELESSWAFEYIPWHVIPTDDIPEQWRLVAGHDWGYDSPGMHLWGAIDPKGGVIIYRELQFKGLDPHDIAETIKYNTGDERIIATYADPSIWQERKKSDLSAEQIRTLARAGKLQLSKAAQYREAGLNFKKANNQRIAGKNRIHTLLKDRGDGVPWLRIMDCCPILINTLANITKDPDNSEDVQTEYLPDDDLRDDPYDALRYLLMGLPRLAVAAGSNILDEAPEEQSSWLM